MLNCMLSTFVLYLTLAPSNTHLGIHALPFGLAPYFPFKGAVETSSYIVMLKENTNKDAHLSHIRSAFGAAAVVSHSDWDAGIVNGYTAKMTLPSLTKLRASPDVDSVHQNGRISIFGETVTQTNATWGLHRISHDETLPDNADPGSTGYRYRYDSSAGQGVDVYVLDTGVNIGHVEFGGRASYGSFFGNASNADDQFGHGTHVAGIIGSLSYGVAKKANIISVRVFGDEGVSDVASVLSGLNWAHRSITQRGRPAVINISIGGAISRPLDQAVSRMISAGIHVVVSAGNGNENAGYISPARVGAAITVGASNLRDEKAPFSNFGNTLDLFAPGTNIISTWIGSSGATNVLDGSSMAAGFVSGLVAYYISVYGNATPAKMAEAIVGGGLPDLMKGLDPSSPNILARNNID